MRVLWLALFLVVAACDSASPITLPGETTIDGVTFRVDRTQLQRGDTLELALVNESGSDLFMGVFGCAIVERQSGDTWETRDTDNEGACILIGIPVGSGETYEEPYQLDVAPGTVRLVHRFSSDRGGDSEIRSPAIRVLD
ncbi:MAG: hypothetical protein AAF170_17915 [Bacteroidota bacterium]